MVAARLSPTPAQFHAVEDIAQDAALALLRGISRLKNRTVRGLVAFVSRIVSRKVCRFIIRPRVPTQSLDAILDLLSSTGGPWLSLVDQGTSPSSAAGRRELVARIMDELV
jgi:DNA-directed RNA polymerase specialized sigma24 family protein